MKHTLIMLLFAGTCLADPPQVTLDGLEVPEAVDVEVVVKKIAKSDLPEGLLEVISNYYWGGGNGEVPDKIDFQIVDLNSDQSPEYFAKTFMGGSGGPLHLIFSKTGRPMPRRRSRSPAGSGRGGISKCSWKAGSA